MTIDSPSFSEQAVRPPGRRGPFRAFGYRDFTLFWLGSILAITAFFMMIITRGQLMLDMTDSPFMVSAITAVPFLPQFFLSLFAGVMADRLNRKAVLMISEAVNMVVLLSLALLVLTDTVQVWQIFLLGVVNGISFSVSLPARNAMVPNLLRSEDLVSGVALVTTVFSGAQLVGPALAGFLMSSYGMGYAFLVPSMLLVPALISFSLLRVKQERGDKVVRVSVVRSILEGFAWVRGQRVILGLLLMGGTATLLGMPYQSLLPVFARDLLSGPGVVTGLLGVPASANEVLTPKLGLGLIAAATGLGAVIGSLTVAFVGDSRYRGLLLVGGGIGFGIVITLFAASPIFLLTFGIAFFLGLFFQLFMTTNFTLIQLLAPDYIRGRVLSIRFLIIGLMPVGTFSVGFGAEVVGTSLTVGVMGGLAAVAMTGIVLAIPALRRV